MSTSPQTNPNDQEIDLSQLSKRIGDFFQSLIDKFFDGILFLIRHKYSIGLLLVVGFALGFYLDSRRKQYDNQVIVTPNFGSTDYLYSKVDLINAKIKEADTVFLKQLGIQEPKEISEIEIEPILDVYRFVNNSQQNFELLKLMAEDGDVKKIVEDNLTSKNYMYHLITYRTKGKTTKDKTLNPILHFLNQSDYFSKIQKEYISNIKTKIQANELTISQINDLMNQFSNTLSNSQRSDKLVYYNENTQLNDVIKTKDELIKEQGQHRVDLVNSDRIVKDSSFTLNLESKSLTNGKMKLILPLVLVGLFVLFGMFRRFYRNQLAKRNLA
ncbi:hypothetical protein [Flavobacterium suncheonense]|uniref:Uncharacterized protein n=1 Tax=Flavobacterium suncheonense GH29-5 = DSM 17707 TaxID=1121899 RepID=A0A0A2ML85_9FLAO|nr:hypothetical protein [Flavobacterium suncheonense]KGO89060.1 hypothetical protein Q764_09715 [Flavobacterium suncheonense GH29-5 = DSM 17707]